MSEFQHVARVVRYMAESTTFNLGFIPDDKLDWKPTPESKSALQVVGEAVGVMRMMLPLFDGDGFPPPNPWVPGSREEAERALAETAAGFASRLDAAGPELERPIETHFGPLWVSYAVLFPMIDLIHHHGQLTYIQSLLGDGENHTDVPSIARWFGPPAA